MRNLFTILTIVSIFTCVLLFPYDSFAFQVNPASIPDNLFDRFQEVMNGTNNFQNHAVTFANHIFFSLAVIAFVCRMYPLVMKSATMEEFVSEISMYVLTMGIFLFFITNGFQFGQLILSSFLRMAQLGIGGTGDLPTPSTPILSGFKFFAHGMDAVYQSSSFDIVKRLSLSGVAMAFLLICTFTSLTMLLCMIEAYLVIYIGVIILGFGSATWTQEMVPNYFKTCLSYGARLFCIILIIDICMSTLETYVNGQTEYSLYSGIEILILGIVMYMMSNKLPEFVSSMMSASFGNHTHAGQAAQTVKTAVETSYKLGKTAAGISTGGAGTAAAMAAEKLAANSQGGSISGGASSPTPPPTPPKP